MSTKTTEDNNADSLKDSKIVDDIFGYTITEQSATLDKHPDLINAILQESGENLVLLSIEKNNDDLLGLLIKRNVDLSYQMKNTGDSALHKAIMLGKNNKIINTLIDGKAPLDLQNNNGDTPMHLAAIKGDYKLIKLLNLSKARKDIKNKKGQLPIDIAIRMGNQKCIQALGGDPGIVRPNRTSTNLGVKNNEFENDKLPEKKKTIFYTNNPLNVNKLQSSDISTNSKPKKSSIVNNDNNEEYSKKKTSGKISFDISKEKPNKSEESYLNKKTFKIDSSEINVDATHYIENGFDFYKENDKKNDLNEEVPQTFGPGELNKVYQNSDSDNNFEIEENNNSSNNKKNEASKREFSLPFFEDDKNIFRVINSVPNDIITQFFSRSKLKRQSTKNTRLNRVNTIEIKKKKTIINLNDEAIQPQSIRSKPTKESENLLKYKEAENESGSSSDLKHELSKNSNIKFQLPTKRERREPNLSMIDKKLFQILKDISMEKYMVNLVEEGFDEYEFLMKQERSNKKLSESDFKKCGIYKLGDRIKILTKLELESGKYKKYTGIVENFDEFITNAFYTYKGENNVKEVKDFNDLNINNSKDSHLKELDNWFRLLKLEEYLGNFLNSGYFSIQLLMLQMVSK